MSLNETIEIGSSVIISLGGGAAIIFGFSNWLGKVWADRLMANEKAKHDRELELLRAEIRQLAFESETRFSKLHEKQAEVIADLFKKIVALSQAAEKHLIGPDVDDNDRKEYMRCENDFASTFAENEIYFELSLCSALSEFLSKLHYANAQKDSWKSYRPEVAPKHVDTWIESLQKRGDFVTQEVPMLKKKLTDEFRRLLGVN